MTRLLFITSLLCLLLLGCDRQSSSAALPNALAAPQRVVSLDYCADQYVLKFVARENILALSPDATADFSYMREQAKDIKTVLPRIENILLLGPDLVVRSYGGGPNATAVFERANIPVLQVPWVTTLDDIPAVVTFMGTGLGSSQAAQNIAAKMQAEMAAIIQSAQRQSVLYVTSFGATSGPGTIIHELIERVGFVNFVDQAGWQPLPLEKLAYSAPDIIIRSFYKDSAQITDQWSASRHRLLQQHMEKVNIIDWDGAWTSCNAWYIVDAIDALTIQGTP